MIFTDSVSFLSILILTTSCLIFTSRAEETEPTEDVLIYLWSLMHPQGEERPDFKEMLLKMSPEEKKKMTQLFDDIMAAQKESGRMDSTL
ncbi:hypothetical protein TNCV_4940161 [Trichonephila clavipes]|nr:hypothetical protein TNCV_4940161 [Trichonephila clavipes]